MHLAHNLKHHILLLFSYSYFSIPTHLGYYYDGFLSWTFFFFCRSRRKKKKTMTSVKQFYFMLSNKYENNL